MKTYKILLSLALLAPAMLSAQTSKEEVLGNLEMTGGVYYAYPATEAQNTKAPKGYKPVYISHYGRHGSRYLIGDRDYEWVAEELQRADDHEALTPLGKSVKQRLDSVLVESRKRGGDLSPLGKRQHRGIAERMYANYPEVFKGNANIDAKSTMVVRCVLSMASFVERLKELNPNLNIDRDASYRWVEYLSHHSKDANEYNNDKHNWRAAQQKFEKQRVNPDRLMQSLFNSPEYIASVDGKDLMWGLYWIASDMQDIETPVSFYDIFEPEELFGIWESNNLNWYLAHVDPTAPDNVLLMNAAPLLENFIESADEALATGNVDATLRFGHDGNLMPLVCLMDLDGHGTPIKDFDTAYETFADFKIVPMAANLQMIFYKNEKDPSAPVLVKFLLNEQEVTAPVATDIFPYYRWDDVKQAFRSRLPQ